MWTAFVASKAFILLGTGGLFLGLVFALLVWWLRFIARKAREKQGPDPTAPTSPRQPSEAKGTYDARD